ADPTFDPREEVFLEEEPEKMQIANCKLQNAECRIIKYEPNKVVIDVDAPGDGFLFLSDSYYPEWKAFVDGKETKIYRANYCFRAVKIKEGRHTVEFKYFPKTFIIGLIGSLAAILLITIVLYVKK
ncbi:YfhO family protein, partial [bacterium]|nr:YfhO family protein [bacterium]